MRQLIAIQFVFILAACASSPTQVEEAIATGYITVESLAESALTAYRGGYIDDSQRNEVADLLDLAQSGLNIATEMTQTNSPVEALRYVSRTYEYFSQIRGILNGSVSDN